MVILVTRPEPGATRTAKRLVEMGFVPYILPLSRTFAVPDVDLTLNGDALLASSEAAFLYLPFVMAEALKDKPLYCVGNKTAEAAKLLGFTNICAVYPKASVLAEKINCPNETQFLYLAGRVRRHELEIRLKTKAYQVKVAEIYDTEAVVIDNKALQNLPASIEAVMLYSGVAAKAMEQIASKLQHETVLMCLSQRIAADIPKNMLNPPVVAYEPDEEAMMEGLVSILQ